MKNVKIKFETARLAKLKGFDKFNRYCDSGYDPNTGKILESQIWDMVCNVKESVGRPTQSLLQKWLRDKFNILLYCLPYDNGWYYQITTFYDDNCITQFNEDTIQIYEEALEKGLQEALKLIE